VATGRGKGRERVKTDSTRSKSGASSANSWEEAFVCSGGPPRKEGLRGGNGSQRASEERGGFKAAQF